MGLVSIIFLLGFSLVIACEIHLPQHVLVMSDEAGSDSIMKSQNCPEAALTEMQNLLLGLEGRIQASRLVAMMRTRGFETVKIEPPLLKVQQLRNLIREKLQLPAGIHVKSTRAMASGNLLALAAGDQVDVRCDSCLWGAQQAVNVVVQEFDGNTRFVHAKVDFRKMVRAYKLTSPLPSFSPISETDVKEEYTEAVPYTDLITDAQLLKFYKTNKPLKTGALLRTSDLNAFNLVKAGLKTEVMLENSMVRIKTHGISRNSGGIGDLVEVYHPEKNKKYQGKVVDINKVLVEL